MTVYKGFSHTLLHCFYILQLRKWIFKDNKHPFQTFCAQELSAMPSNSKPLFFLLLQCQYSILASLCPPSPLLPPPPLLPLSPSLLLVVWIFLKLKENKNEAAISNQHITLVYLFIFIVFFMGTKFLSFLRHQFL